MELRSFSPKSWIAGLRRDQSKTRAQIDVLESYSRDDGTTLIKVNPLAAWTRKDTWNYLFAHDVPYNPLHDAGYPSIGCTHCTRAVGAGEPERAGRWAGRAKTECGLHGDGPKVVPLKLQL